VFLESFCRSKLPRKSVNLSFTITHAENELTDCAENDFQKTWCEIRLSKASRRNTLQTVTPPSSCCFSAERQVIYRSRAKITSAARRVDKQARVERIRHI
jgi:hypothetical protein